MLNYQVENKPKKTGGRSNKYTMHSSSAEDQGGVPAAITDALTQNQENRSAAGIPPATRHSRGR